MTLSLHSTTALGGLLPASTTPPRLLESQRLTSRVPSLLDPLPPTPTLSALRSLEPTFPTYLMLASTLVICPKILMPFTCLPRLQMSRKPFVTIWVQLPFARITADITSAGCADPSDCFMLLLETLLHAWLDALPITRSNLPMETLVWMP